MTVLLKPIPIHSPYEMLVGSEEKVMCLTSERFHLILLITWVLTDTRRSNNIQKKKIGWKIKIQHRPDKQYP